MNYKCNICDSSAYKVISRYRAKSPYFADKSIVQCASCNFLSAYPLPREEELELYYNSYWSRHDYEKKMSLFRAQAQARYEFLAPFLSDISELNILDVGASFGLFYEVIAKNMKKCKISYNATEIDPIAVDFLKRNIKPANLYNNTMEAKGKYDLIVLSHIIEHLIDPKGFVIKQREKLNDSGLVFVEVPNQDYLFKAYNEPHLNFFKPETLKRLFQETGFSVLNINTCGLTLDFLSKSNKKANNFKTLKGFVKKILPEYIVKRLKAVRDTNNEQGPFNYIFEYGLNRAWIRLVTRK